jgi:hypothetical protein
MFITHSSLKPFFNRRHLQTALCCTTLVLALTGCSADGDSKSAADLGSADSSSSVTTGMAVKADSGDAADAVATTSSVSPSPAAAPAKMEARRESKRMDAMAETVAEEAVSVDVMTKKSKHLPDQNVAQSGLLTAGDIDDLRNFDFFLGYAQRTQNQCPDIQNQSIWPSISLDNRITLKISDKHGKPVPNAAISVGNGMFGKQSVVTTTSEGMAFLFPLIDGFPSLDGLDAHEKFSLTITAPEGKSQTVHVSLAAHEQDDATVNITLNHYTAHNAQAMDVMFVIDATGSMGDEIRYLQTEFDGIVSRLSSNNPQVSLRYGLVMYRDMGDDYVVRDYGFTNNPRVLRDQLRKQQADGGGDYPEAMEQAIEKAVDARWRDGNTAKVMFLVADAPPHDENLARAFTSFKQARKEGIRIYPLGASGVADTAEYLMRMGSVMTQGRYLFLTDDSGVGNSHAEPKVPCYVVTPLNQLIERVLNSELRGTRVEPSAGSIIREVGRYNHGECEK